MAEWSIARDCKSLAHWATQVRILLYAQYLFFITRTKEVPGDYEERRNGISGL